MRAKNVRLQFTRAISVQSSDENRTVGLEHISKQHNSQRSNCVCKRSSTTNPLWERWSKLELKPSLLAENQVRGPQSGLPDLNILDKAGEQIG
jgi:hypothetical protein